MTESPTFKYVHHPHIATRIPAVAPPPPAEPSAIGRFNKKLALKITGGVGTMWCAYAFAMFALTGFPGLLPTSLSKYALWGSTVFSQLVLLSVILVGQNSQAATGEKRAQATYLDAEAVLHEAQQIQQHLLAQDKMFERIVSKTSV